MTEELTGTVTRIRSVLCEVDAGGKTYECKARGRLVESDTGQSKPVVVGDRVVIRPIEQNEGIIEEVLPRQTKLSRRLPNDPRVEHVIAANVEQLLIVASVRQPPLTLGIIDRYIIAGEAEGLECIICINKTDLAGDSEEHLEAARMYREMDYSVLLTSATTGEGIPRLREVLRDSSTVLAGHSGVGKSALINAVEPGLELRTAPVTTKGRHTTSSVSLLKLDIGGYVVDTPGIREFTLWEIEKGEVQQFFPRIWELSADCQLPDCLHTHEPDCAVKAALERGELPEARYDSYARIVETVETPQVPRDTDVEQPHRQITRKKRRPSRRVRKQELLRRAELELEEEEES
ncbi:MAG: ribosome small subunit-dependent GTPase A [Candidatus Brocadiaceae bacterium]|jgi:ribosome biogenesis GTPase